MRGLRLDTFGFFGGLAALTMMAAAPAPAQTPRSSVDMQTSQPVPQFRDPKTGQIWTPLNVGLQSGPPTPQDLAFEPLGQDVYVKGVVTQQPSIVPLSTVPITATCCPGGGGGTGCCRRARRCRSSISATPR